VAGSPLQLIQIIAIDINIPAEQVLIFLIADPGIEPEFDSHPQTSFLWMQ
jgi:hypothetical protein